MNSSFARFLYFAAQQWRGEPVARALREIESSQHWPLERLLEQQWQRTQRLIRHAYDTVPYYRTRWTALGFEPGDLKTPADWERLPVLEKADLQERRAELMSSSAPSGLDSATSGSSGTPVVVHRSHLAWAYQHANIFRCLRWHGVNVGDRYAYFWGLAPGRDDRRFASRKDLLFNRDRCSAFDLDGERAVAFYERLRRHPVRYAYGYASAIVRFANEITERGLDAGALRWKAVFTTAETFRSHQRERLKAVFGCPVANLYGCAEAGNPSSECEHGIFHVGVESAVVDLLGAADGSRELLLTELHNFSQPVIRYRVGDMAEERSGPCACGRALPTHGLVTGRAADTLTLPDGRRISGHMPSYVFKHHAASGTVREYQFVQFPDGRIELRITTGPAWSEAVRSELLAEVRQLLKLEVEIKLVPRFTRTGRGKHRDFVRVEEADR